MPLPDVAFERRLGIDLELVDVDPFAEQLHERLDQARMVRHQAKSFVVGVRGKRGARSAGLFAPDFRALALEDGFGFAAQNCNFFLGEAAGEKQEALLVESFDLCR